MNKFVVILGPTATGKTSLAISLCKKFKGEIISVDSRQAYREMEIGTGKATIDNGQVTIIGGSDLFHGAPLFGLKVASRIVDMVFFTSPEPGQNSVISSIKATLSSFIWVPFEEVAAYIEKSDAVLIGPGLMRYSKETVNINDGDCDQECVKTREVTRQLLKKPQRQIRLLPL